MDTKYDRKFEELKKYIRFLEYMTKRLENLRTNLRSRQAQLVKIRYLRNLLLGKEKRTTFNDLLQYEKFLVNLYREQRDPGPKDGALDNKASEKEDLNPVRKKLKTVDLNLQSADVKTERFLRSRTRNHSEGRVNHSFESAKKIYRSNFDARRQRAASVGRALFKDCRKDNDTKNTIITRPKKQKVSKFRRPCAVGREIKNSKLDFNDINENLGSFKLISKIQRANSPEKVLTESDNTVNGIGVKDTRSNEAILSTSGCDEKNVQSTPDSTINSHKINEKVDSQNSVPECTNDSQREMNSDITSIYNATETLNMELSESSSSHTTSAEIETFGKLLPISQDKSKIKELGSLGNSSIKNQKIKKKPEKLNEITSDADTMSENNSDIMNDLKSNSNNIKKGGKNITKLPTCEVIESQSVTQAPVDCFTDETYCFINIQSCYNCRMCSYRGKEIVAHYKRKHPHSEIPLSRMSSTVAKEAIEESKKLDFQAIYKFSSKKYVCRFCFEEFSISLKAFLQHIVSVHTGEYKLLCSECLNVTSCPFKQVIPSEPKEIKGQLLGYICEKCSYTQISLENLKSHVILRHSDEKTAVHIINLSVMSKCSKSRLQKFNQSFAESIENDTTEECYRNTNGKGISISNDLPIDIDSQETSRFFCDPHFKIKYTDTGPKEYVCCINGDFHYRSTLLIALQKHLEIHHIEVWDGFCCICKVIVTPQGDYYFKDCLQHYLDKHKPDSMPIFEKIISEPNAPENDFDNVCNENVTATTSNDVPPLSELISQTPPSSQPTEENNFGLPVIVKIVSLASETEQSSPSQSYPSKEQTIIKKIPKYEEVQAETMSKKHGVVLNVMMSNIKLAHVFKCAGPYCSFTTDIINDALTHVSTHVRVGGVDCWNCAYCDYDACYDAVGLVTHIFKIHGRCPYVCNLCFYRAATALLVDAHIKRVHEKEKKHQILHSSFRIGPNTEEHILSREEALQFYICTVGRGTDAACDYKTYTAERYSDHFSLIHESETDFFCWTCPMKFSTVSDLVTHMKIHGIKLYHCAWCACGCDSKAELLAHSSSNHPDKVPKAYLRIITRKEGEQCKVLPFAFFNETEVASVKVASENLIENPVKEAEKSADLERLLTQTQHFYASTSASTAEVEAYSISNTFQVHPVVVALDSDNESDGQNVVSQPITDTQYVKKPTGPMGRKRSLDSIEKAAEPPEKVKKFEPHEIHLLPVKAILDYSVTCSICQYSTEVRFNMVRHLLMHTMQQQVFQMAPVETNEKQSEKTVDLASSSIMPGTVMIQPKAASSYPQYVHEKHRFTCGEKDCFYISIDESMMKHHWETLHSKSIFFYCQHCLPQQHLYTNEPLTASGVIDHLKMHGPDLYACSLCPYYHYRRELLENHCNYLHNDGKFIAIRKNYICEDKGLIRLEVDGNITEHQSTSHVEGRNCQEGSVPHLLSPISQTVSLTQTEASVNREIDLNLVKNEAMGVTPETIQKLCEEFGEFCEPSGLKYMCPLCKELIDTEETMQSHLYEKFRYRKQGCNEHMQNENQQNCEPASLQADVRIVTWVTQLLEHQTALILKKKENLAKQNAPATASVFENSMSELKIYFGSFGALGNYSVRCPRCTVFFKVKVPLENFRESEIKVKRLVCRNCLMISEIHVEFLPECAISKVLRICVYPENTSQRPMVYLSPVQVENMNDVNVNDVSMHENSTPETDYESDEPENSLLVVLYEEIVPFPDLPKKNKYRRTQRTSKVKKILNKKQKKKKPSKKQARARVATK